MAKLVKSKKIVKIAKKSEEIVQKYAPPIAPGLISIAMLPSDLATLTNLMGICAKSFEEQAGIAAQNNDEQKYAIFSARHKLSSMFANRFVEFCNLGEPESRDVH